MTTRKSIDKTRTATKDAEAPPTRRKIEPSALIAASAVESEVEAAVPGESGRMVTVMIPKDYKLTLDGSHHEVQYRAGIDEMPIEHAEHWFSKAIGVEIYRKGKTRE